MMGNAAIPASVDEASDPFLIDEGTLVRAESPTPDSTGLDPLDTKGGSPAKNGPSMASRIVSYVRQRLGQRVGDGECFTLVDLALRDAGARSAADFGTLTPNADYVWGAPVNLSDLRAGDIIQFRDYQFSRTVVTEDTDGTSTVEDGQTRPHHTAVVERVDGDGAVIVLEQNAPVGAPVSRTLLFFTGSTTTSDNQTTTIAVEGTFRFYRPQAH